MDRVSQEWVVRKRDGRSVSFEPVRIHDAITNAFRAELNLADRQALEDDALQEIASLTATVEEGLCRDVGAEGSVDVEPLCPGDPNRAGPNPTRHRETPLDVVGLNGAG